jgi:hypothetical protein
MEKKELIETLESILEELHCKQNDSDYPEDENFDKKIKALFQAIEIIKKA